MRKKCIFCQRDDRKITKEHVFPDWLSQMFGDEVTGRNEGVNADGSITFNYESKIFQQTINSVCHDCNNGWMSEIENAAKPILIKMLRHKNFVIDKKSQQKLANWVMKTILVVNHNNPSPPSAPFIPQSHYNKFYELKGINPDNLMTLGYLPSQKYKPGQRIASNWLVIAEYVQVHKDLADEITALQEGGKKIYGATMNLANMVFQLIGHDLAEDGSRKLEVSLPTEPMRVLFPYENKIRWPMQNTVYEFGGLEAIHEALKGGRD